MEACGGEKAGGGEGGGTGLRMLTGNAVTCCGIVSIPAEVDTIYDGIHCWCDCCSQDVLPEVDTTCYGVHCCCDCCSQDVLQQNRSSADAHPPIGSPMAASKPADMMIRLGLNS